MEYDLKAIQLRHDTLVHVISDLERKYPKGDRGTGILNELRKIRKNHESVLRGINDCSRAKLNEPHMGRNSS